jgi:hypothetical protein
MKMESGPKNFSNNNPGTEAFDRGQKRWAFPVLVLASLAAILAEGASLVALPVLLGIGALFLLIIIGGARLIRTLGLKFLERRRSH